MAALTKADSYRIGRVTCYRHHAAWWIRWSDPDEAARAPDGRACLRRKRVGRSGLEAEFQASLQNAELLRRELGWATSAPAPLPAPAPAVDPPLPEAAAELLASIARLARTQMPVAGVTGAAAAEFAATPPALPPKTVAEVRAWHLDWHENVRGTSAGSLTRYGESKQLTIEEAPTTSIESKYFRFPAATSIPPLAYLPIEDEDLDAIRELVATPTPAAPVYEEEMP